MARQDGATDDLTLKVWRLHPSSCRIVPAEKTLNQTANKGGVRWCGPFTNANRAGWWVFPPVDIDIVWKGGAEFEYEELSPYSDADWHVTRFLLDEKDEEHVDTWSCPGGRMKFAWGLVEPAVVQIWTGCIFQTPPGWALQIRSPINVPARACHVMEAILETEWLYYDIWLNVVFDRPNELVRLRRDEWPPLAQLVSVPRASYDASWKLEEEVINRNSAEADRVFSYWVDYNRKKFASDGKNPMPLTSLKDSETVFKDSATYFKERKRLLGGQKCPVVVVPEDHPAPPVSENGSDP
ncbi:MAG TPA: DUF6065 family protein [Gaiellaceae bacterium]